MPTSDPISTRTATPVRLDAHRSRPASARVVVCRGCCCGNPAKQPDVDHDAQLRELETLAPVRVVDCLGHCERSNVVIVRPPGGAQVWLGPVRGELTVGALHDWLAAGATDPLPIELELIQFHRD